MVITYCPACNTVNGGSTNDPRGVPRCNTCGGTITMAQSFIGQAVGNYELVPFMIKEGLVPDECTWIQVEFPVDGAVSIMYRVNVTEGRLAAFQRAFNAYLESIKPKEEE